MDGRATGEKAISGRCMCGQVTYEAHGPTAFVACYCRDCRYSSGGGPATILVVSTDHFRLTGGTELVAGYTVVGESGHNVTRQFCKVCGTPLFERLDILEPGSMLIKVGTIDDQSALSVEATAWTKSAPGWAAIDRGTALFEENPAAEFVESVIRGKSAEQ